LEKEIIQGSIPHCRTRGRPNTTWMNNIKSWTRLLPTELVKNVEDRYQWRKIVHDAGNPRSDDG